MNNQELDRLLKSARAPQPREDYWHQLPKRIMRKISLSEASLPVRQTDPPNFRSLGAFGNKSWFSLPRFAFLAVAIACITAGAFLLLRNGVAPENGDSQWTAARKYYHEIASLFPNQVRAIALDETGAHLDLAETPTVPLSKPVYLRICDPGGCRSFITFSGQQIKLGSEVVEVFRDGQGDVLVVGPSFVWSSSDPARKGGRYRIQARALQETS